MTTRAEVKVENALVEHNIPLAITDHLGPLFKGIFTESEIAKNYTSGKTKTNCVINRSLALHYRSSLVAVMISGPFSIATDGSSDTNTMGELYSYFS